MYDNLSAADRVPFDFVTSYLKDLDTPLYAVGGVTRDGDYNDIDLSVNVSTSNDALISNIRLTPLENRLEYLSGLAVEDIITPDSPHISSWEREYGELTKRYRFSFEMDGHETTFDIGAMNNPFVDNPDRRYAKL